MARLLLLALLVLPACRNKDDTAQDTATPSTTGVIDADNDGSPVDLDCDDGNGAVYPGNTETAYNGLDDDCNEATPDDDLDSDGAGIATDCDDEDPAVHPDATEICNGLDDDCDTLVDDDDPDLVDAPTWSQDFDGDGYGGAEVQVAACEAPEGYLADSTDCDDGDSAVNPAATPVCDGSDADCDGAIDNDLDGDGFADSACGADDCDDTDAGIFPDPSGPCAEGTSCQDLLDRGYGTTDGTYTVDPDGYGTGEDPEEVWCDQTVFGGGWTLVGVSETSSAGWGADEITDDSGFGSVSLTDSYKGEVYATVPFADLYFTDGTLSAVYDGVSDGSLTLYDFQASVPQENCGSSDGYRWSMTDGDLAGGALCDTDLYMHPQDEDGGSNAACDPEQLYADHGTGPTWSVANNDGCPLDDPSGTGFGSWSSTTGWDNGSALQLFVR